MSKYFYSVRFVFFFPFPSYTDKLPALLNKVSFRDTVKDLGVSDLYFWKLTIWYSEHSSSNEWREGVSHHQAAFWMLTGCPTLQLNSGTMYLEVAPDSTGYGVSSTTLHGHQQAPTSSLSLSLSLTHTHTHTHTSDVNHKPRLSSVLLTDWP